MTSACRWRSLDRDKPDSDGSELGNPSDVDDADLPPWLSGREHWTIEIAHWNNTPAEDAGPKKCIVLAHQFSTGQNDTTMGHVLAQMKTSWGRISITEQLSLFCPQRLITVSNWITKAATRSSGNFSTPPLALSISALPVASQSARSTKFNYSTT